MIHTSIPAASYVAPETWAKGSSINSLKDHYHCHAHLLASLQLSGLSDPMHASSNWKLSTAPEMEPL